VRRGTCRWRPALIAVLFGVVAAASALPASGSARDAAAAPGGTANVATQSAVSKYRLRVDAVAYHLPGRTASGLPVGKGVVAVDPKLIPLGTRLFIPGYGRGIAADVGVAIKGLVIDLWMPNHSAARKWGRRTVMITVYR
jgi:3D (Asp-Asp-Asp) domain-containing protein